MLGRVLGRVLQTVGVLQQRYCHTFRVHCSARSGLSNGERVLLGHLRQRLLSGLADPAVRLWLPKLNLSRQKQSMHSAFV